jgi:hypothetical protein
MMSMVFRINEAFIAILNVKCVFSNFSIKLHLFLATTSLHNRSVFSKQLINTSAYSPQSHTTVSVQPNVQNSFLNGGVSKADLPYRSLAQFGVLSK